MKLLWFYFIHWAWNCMPWSKISYLSMRLFVFFNELGVHFHTWVQYIPHTQALSFLPGWKTCLRNDIFWSNSDHRTTDLGGENGIPMQTFSYARQPLKRTIAQLSDNDPTYRINHSSFHGFLCKYVRSGKKFGLFFKACFEAWTVFGA
jgi:hypothetical protein